MRDKNSGSMDAMWRSVALILQSFFKGWGQTRMNPLSASAEGACSSSELVQTAEETVPLNI